ncbi:hypothetical protein [Sphingomonas sp. MMS24-J13]|uniref:hypothetical protein n=1 Tax=Sphingomonas sp. MMS24-J13 TaxID=3238686 RepID=UPI00384B8E2D
MAGEPLTALIGAYEPGPAGLRALMPIAGMTLVEQQARRASTAGATHILLLVEEVSPDLVAAVGRLRSDGLTVGMAEGIDVAADALAEQQVLVIADGCLPEPRVLRDLAALPVPAVTTLADIADHERYERIDANARWGGVALVDGHRVAETATILGSWDPISTLLRRAVQEGAIRLAVDEAAPLLLVDSASVSSAEAAIVAAARLPAGDWISRFVFAPIEELVLPFLLARRINAIWPTLAAAGLAMFGGGMAWAGWRWLTLVCLLLAGPIAAGASRLARVQARTIPFERGFAAARLIGAALGASGLATGLAMASGQWGWWLVAAIVLIMMTALEAVCRLSERGRSLWLASADASVWTILPFAIAGWWGAGLAALAVYASLSFAWELGWMVREKMKIG